MSGSRASTHLTDEQFSDLLAGESPDDTLKAHLDHCEYCRHEVASVSRSLQGFNLYTEAWARVEAPRRVQIPPRWALRLSRWPACSLGLAGTAVACVIALGSGLSFTHAPDDATAPQLVQGPSNAELAQDNRLLQNIDQELSYNVEPVIPASELRVADVQRRSPLASASVTN